MAARQHAGVNGGGDQSVNLSKLVVKEENENGDGDASEPSQISQSLLTPRSSTEIGSSSVLKNATRNRFQSNDSGASENMPTSSSAAADSAAAAATGVHTFNRPSKLQTLMLNKNQPPGETKMTKLARLAATREPTLST